jgi:hypothetical protein
MALGRSVNSACQRTGLSRPECCCPDCLTDQIRAHQPGLLESALREAEGAGEIQITRMAGPAARPGEITPGS